MRTWVGGPWYKPQESRNLFLFLVKRVPGKGLEQQESGKTTFFH